MQMLKPTVVLNKYSMHVVGLRIAGEEAAKKWCAMAHGMLWYMCVMAHVCYAEKAGSLLW